MHNLELKAHYPNPQKAIDCAESLGLQKEWTRKQTDTYYVVADGKLKLRQVDGLPAELIAYKRPDIADAKVSNYCLYFSHAGDKLNHVLAHVLTMDAQVIKQRTLYLWQNVRIHIDRVEQLGDFIEFEAVLDEKEDIALSRHRLDFLRSHFHIQEADLIHIGYYDLLKQRNIHA